MRLDRALGAAMSFVIEIEVFEISASEKIHTIQTVGIENELPAQH